MHVVTLVYTNYNTCLQTIMGIMKMWFLNELFPLRGWDERLPEPFQKVLDTATKRVNVVNLSKNSTFSVIPSYQ